MGKSGEPLKISDQSRLGTPRGQEWGLSGLLITVSPVSTAGPASTFVSKLKGGGKRSCEGH